MKYIKKPIVIDAIQWQGNNFSQLMDYYGRPSKISANPFQDDQLNIRTLEGLMSADIGDWVIKGIEGEYYSCRDSVFKKSYEKVEQL